MPERGDRLRLITEAAHACAREAQTEEAVELFLYAGQPCPALHILNLQLSELLEPALQDPALSASPSFQIKPIMPIYVTAPSFGHVRQGTPSVAQGAPCYAPFVCTCEC